VIDQIPWAAIGGFTPSGLLTFAVWLVLTGKIVPKSTYDTMCNTKEAWKDSSIKKDEIIHTQVETIRVYSVVGKRSPKSCPLSRRQTGLVMSYGYLGA